MSDTAMGVALVGGVVGATVIAILIFYVLVVIACWKIFNKMGEPGWKAIIPIYDEYILFKHCWNTNMFWIDLVLGFVGALLMYVDTSMGIVYIIGSLALLAAYIIEAIIIFYVGKSFGHGVPFFILCLILPNIALLYLGFNKEAYQGNTTKQ